MLKPKWLTKIESHLPEKTRLTLYKGTDDLSYVARGFGKASLNASVTCANYFCKSFNYAADIMDKTIEKMHEKGLI